MFSQYIFVSQKKEMKCKYSDWIPKQLQLQVLSVEASWGIPTPHSYATHCSPRPAPPPNIAIDSVK
jgi:hypothetical protein